MIDYNFYKDKGTSKKQPSFIRYLLDKNKKNA